MLGITKPNGKLNHVISDIETLSKEMDENDVIIVFGVSNEFDNMDVKANVADRYIT